ncbi:MAG: MFS transporter [Bacillota bacterium]
MAVPNLKSAFSPLKLKDYRLLWLGLFVSNTGSWMQSAAQAWLVYRLTGSTVYLSLIPVCQALPRIVFSAVGGAVADRYNRRLLLYGTQCLMAACAGILGVATTLGVVRVWMVLLLATVSSLGMAFDAPARQSLLPQLVPREEVPKAVALHSMTFNGSAIFGPSIAGLVLDVLGADWCFYLNALSFLAVIVAIRLMEFPPHQPASDNGSIVGNLAEAVAVVWDSPRLLLTMIYVTVVVFFGRPYNQLMAAFADTVLHAGARGYGLLMAAPGVGMLAGLTAVALVGSYPGKGRKIQLGTVCFALALIAFSWSRSLYLCLMWLVVVGFFEGFTLAVGQTILQISVPDDVRGRILGLYGTMTMGIGPLGSLLAGAVSSRTGVPLALSGGGAVILLFVLVSSACCQ